MDIPSLGDRLKTVRCLLDMKQHDFAKVARLSPSAVSRMEADSFPLSRAKLDYLCRSISVNHSYVADGKGNIFPSSKKLIVLRFSSRSWRDIDDTVKALRVLAVNDNIGLSYRFLRGPDSTPLTVLVSEGKTRYYLIVGNAFPSSIKSTGLNMQIEDFCAFVTHSETFREFERAITDLILLLDEKCLSRLIKTCRDFRDYIAAFKSFITTPGAVCPDPSLLDLPGFNLILRNPRQRQQYLRCLKRSLEFFLLLTSFIEERVLDEIWVSPSHDRRIVALIEQARKMGLTGEDFFTAYQIYARSKDRRAQARKRQPEPLS